jgi:hypothetical protein
MDAEAVASLQLVKGPLGVVSVCGRARQGKSFILNQVRAKFPILSSQGPNLCEQFFREQKYALFE